MGRRSGLHKVCWQKIHKLLLSCSTETLARRWEMVHLLAEPMQIKISWNCTIRQCFYFRTQWREIYRVPGPGSRAPPSLWRWHSQQEWKQRTRKSCQAQQWCKHQRKEGSKGPPLTWLHYWPVKNVKHNWSRQNPMKGITHITVWIILL